MLMISIDPYLKDVEKFLKTLYISSTFLQIFDLVTRLIFSDTLIFYSTSYVIIKSIRLMFS